MIRHCERGVKNAFATFIFQFSTKLTTFALFFGFRAIEIKKESGVNPELYLQLYAL